VPRGILRVLINLLDENVFQNPNIFRKTLRLSPEPSTLVRTGIIFSLVSTNMASLLRLLFLPGQPKIAQGAIRVRVEKFKQNPLP
jgi:hypothetical protein